MGVTHGFVDSDFTASSKGKKAWRTGSTWTSALFPLEVGWNPASNSEGTEGFFVRLSNSLMSGWRVERLQIQGQNQLRQQAYFSFSRSLQAWKRPEGGEETYKTQGG